MVDIFDMKWLDVPANEVSPMIVTFTKTWAEGLGSEADRTIAPLMGHIFITARGARFERRRAFLCLDWLIRCHLPCWLEAIGLDDESRALVACPMIGTLADLRFAEDALAAAYGAAAKAVTVSQNHEHVAIHMAMSGAFAAQAGMVCGLQGTMELEPAQRITIPTIHVAELCAVVAMGRGLAGPEVMPSLLLEALCRVGSQSFDNSWSEASEIMMRHKALANLIAVRSAETRSATESDVDPVMSAATRAFLDEIEAVFRKHGKALLDGDGMSGFRVMKLDELAIERLRNAYDVEWQEF